MILSIIILSKFLVFEFFVFDMVGANHPLTL